VFAFAHLTFQEYLAACAIHEGNPWSIEPSQLAKELGDGRWNEVIALYCGLAPTPAARKMLSCLLEKTTTNQLGPVLTDSYFSSGAELSRDHELRQVIIRRLATLPLEHGGTLHRFSHADTYCLSHELLCEGEFPGLNNSCYWLMFHAGNLDNSMLLTYISGWRSLSVTGLSNLAVVVHSRGDECLISAFAQNEEAYSAPAVSKFECVGGLAIWAISLRLGPAPCSTGRALIAGLSRITRIPADFSVTTPLRVVDQEIGLVPEILRLAEKISEKTSEEGLRSRFLSWINGLKRQLDQKLGTDVIAIKQPKTEREVNS
jgi:hypothetical protein